MSDILSSIKTKEESIKVLHGLDEYISSNYVKGSKEKTLVPTYIYKELSAVKDKASKLDKIISQIKEAEVIEVTFGFSPEDAFVKKLYAWFSKQGLKNFLIDIKFEETLNGGCQIIYKGKYMDLSLSHILKEPAYASYTRI